MEPYDMEKNDTERYDTTIMLEAYDMKNVNKQVRKVFETIESVTTTTCRRCG